MISITPKISVSPAAIRAYTPPVSTPSTTALASSVLKYHSRWVSPCRTVRVAPPDGPAQRDRRASLPDRLGIEDGRGGGRGRDQQLAGVRLVRAAGAGLPLEGLREPLEFLARHL